MKEEMNRMKSREAYKITAVRLVEFHNLGTTTIEIPEGGHLFLLGDNGSGKTTILDAIHLVLTAGREMEFNSAARVAGAKDSGGRTIQGIVLRYNAVTGKTAREEGITYAAVELKSDSGRICSLVVGLSARGMDVAYERWGGIASVAVADIPLLVEENGRFRASTQSEFKNAFASIPGGKYYGHINDYADKVGERFFGGEVKYADVCKLLRTGKAYREIAARAANYDDLFRQLLEPPSRDAFEPLLKGLREIEDSKGKLEQIDERANYLDELRRESEKLGKLRLKSKLVSWSEEEQKRLSAEESINVLVDKEKESNQRIKSLENELAGIQDEIKRARERLADLRAKDKSGLINREKSVKQRFDELNRKANEAERTYAEKRSELEAAKKRAKKASENRAKELEKVANELIMAGKTASCSVGGVTDALYEASSEDREITDFTELFVECRSKISEVHEKRSEILSNYRLDAEIAQKNTEKLQRELDEIRSFGECFPNVEGFVEARTEIRAHMLGARPIYELFEPASGCDQRRLALLERLAGDDFLATWMTRKDEADTVRQFVWRCGEQMTVALYDETFDDSVNNLAPWLGSFISFEESNIHAIGLLLKHLASKIGPNYDDFLSKKIWTFRGREGLLPVARPRLIGRKAREEEQARQVKNAEARLVESEKIQKDAEKKRLSAEEALNGIKNLEKLLLFAQDSVRKEANIVREALTSVKLAEERSQAAEKEAINRKNEANVTQEELEDIRIKMCAEGIDSSLEKRIASTERLISTRETDADRKSRNIGTESGELNELVYVLKKKEKEALDATAQANALKSEFESRIPEGMDVATFVKSECPQCQEIGADFALIREQFAKESGKIEERIELRIREPKGEAYAFTFDKSANAIVDRRGSSLLEVLEDETQRLDELRDVLNQKSREVFERIFMGEVMNRLYWDWIRINDLTGRIHRKLAGRRFGVNRYKFGITPVPEYEHFIELVSKRHVLDSSSDKDELHEYLSDHREEILNAEIDEIPSIFDYRKWYKFELKVVTENEEGRVIDRRVKSMGSGGEQAVPNYLLILTVAEFLYHGGSNEESPKTAPILFDEAFYGIDAARRDQLLAFADDLGLQLFVSSPDQDGVKHEIRHSVSLIVIKDENLNVHLHPVVWSNVPSQGDLFKEETFEERMVFKEEI